MQFMHQSFERKQRYLYIADVKQKTIIIKGTIFTWLNAAAFITLVLKLMQQLFIFYHHSMLENNVKALILSK